MFEEYAHLITHIQNESVFNRVKNTSNQNVETTVDDMVGYQLGDLYPNNDKPIGVVLKRNPLTILSFDERRERIDCLVDNFDYNHRKWYKIGWFIPSVEEMRLVFQNQDIINDAIEKANVPEEPEWDWDDEYNRRPNFDTVPNPYRKSKVVFHKEYMTREPYSEDNVYWKSIDSEGRLDFCSWVDSCNLPTRILGEVKPVSESVFNRVKNTNRGDLESDVDSNLRIIEKDGDMIDCLKTLFKVDLYKVYRGQQKYASEEDALYDNIKFVPSDTSQDNQLVQLYTRCCEKSDLDVPKSLYFDVVYDDEETQEYYLRVLFELEWSSKFCFWDELSVQEKRRIFMFISNAKIE